MNGFERLEKQVLDMKNYIVTTIFEYLKTREDLKEYFENEEKNMEQMYEYVCDKARPKAYKNVAVVNNNVVYLWAVNYFIKSNEELGITKKDTITVTNKEPQKDKKIKQENKKDKNDEQITLFQEVQK